MSSTPREIGTLIVVVLKANHLPNKRHIGKQDPYCVVTVNGEKRRTKAIKRGGQHPEWDDEIRFTLYEDTEDVLARTAKKDGSPPPLPPKSGSPLKKIKGGKLMKLACYADDSREPDLIGDADVDLTEVLTKGETDEWFTLTNKDKFAGKVYLELTFWSNEPPPEKKVTPKPARNNRQYGGPGSFIPSGEARPHPPRSASFSGYGPPDLYVAPYEQTTPVDNLTQEFGEFGVSRRRESFPPVHGAYPPHGAQGSYNGSVVDGSLGYGYDHSISSAGQSSGFYGSYSTSSILTNPYDTQSNFQYQPAIRGPRHSIPATSSGFMPVGQTSGFPPAPGEPYPPISHTPHPAAYSNPPPQPYPGQPTYAAPQNSPPQGDPYMSGSVSGPISYQPPYGYQQYNVPTSVSAPQQYEQHPSSAPLAPNGAPPGLAYQPYVSQPGHPDNPPPIANPLPPPPPPPPTGGATVGGSRPLPPQPIVYTQPITQQLDSPQRINSYSPSLQPGDISPRPHTQSYPLPVPPPPPPMQYSENYDPNVAHAVSPPPPPPPTSGIGRTRRHSSLPQPPVAYNQSQQYPPPPPPPINHVGQPNDYYNQLPQPPLPPPPIASHNAYQPGLPPPPPPLDGQVPWPSYSSQ
ncbi:hypothetical protein D9611_002334 [Ephemerocybe angulata]|uniref:C2 domain-containing protein n=1 Tax=Ephemerocybe angulata TaxID=980116 RepID=A0A8H5C171_9AGAR|nr:hypothetical protein D9611_002334 [Tulosesus angulatus]